MSSAHPSHAMRDRDYWRRYPVETTPGEILGMLKRVPFSSTGEDFELLMFERGAASPTAVISPGSAGHAFVFAELGYLVCSHPGEAAALIRDWFDETPRPELVPPRTAVRGPAE